MSVYIALKRIENVGPNRRTVEPGELVPEVANWGRPGVAFTRGEVAKISDAACLAIVERALALQESLAAAKVVEPPKAPDPKAKK